MKSWYSTRAWQSLYTYDVHYIRSTRTGNNPALRVPRYISQTRSHLHGGVGILIFILLWPHVAITALRNARRALTATGAQAAGAAVLGQQDLPLQLRRLRTGVTSAYARSDIQVRHTGQTHRSDTDMLLARQSSNSTYQILRGVVLRARCRRCAAGSVAFREPDLLGGVAPARAAAARRGSALGYA